MSAQENVALIQKTYAAFMRGDAAGILEFVSDDVDWGIEAKDASVPWYGTGKGKAFALKFFQSLGQSVEFSRFEPSARSTSGSKNSTARSHHEERVSTRRAFGGSCSGLVDGALGVRLRQL